ncbi:MAG: DUF4381 domain-containing protein [Roseibium sp.]|uniref:DUF4381 domain-containing protein n=1 Tax=Roseibium sp. TaxID=1936156 RepID=UPI0026086C0E|nr:DUF4381 domain-containing protein [Roseibium sp.]MCV0428113.1 DUF4381 domain-containing protein [Roseibium sp.]
MTPEFSPHILAQLDQLRDIRLPAPVSWWPLAPGWWAVAAFILAACTAVTTWSILRRRTVRYAALKELETLRQKETPVDFSALATDVSALLRRVAIRLKGHSVGILSDRDWADYLSSGKNGMPQQTADLLAQAPYAPSKPASDADKKVLVEAAERWIRRFA